MASAEPIYILPKDDVAEQVIVPALKASQSAQVMIGYFSSASFAEFAPGLASYLRSSSEPLQLIISPFLTPQDRVALATVPDAVVQMTMERLEASLPDADALATHTLRCLAWLHAAGRLQIKVAFMRDALFHSKVWLFEGHDFDGRSERAALHGSANLTAAGLGRNREQLSLSRSWSGEDPARTCQRLSAEFDLLWHGGDADCIVHDLPHALATKLVRDYRFSDEPREEDCRLLWRRAHGLPEKAPAEPPLSKPQVFSVPEWLNYRQGDFSHQGLAIDAWEAADRRGVLEMCTGSGKTLTALTAAQLLHEAVGAVLIVIAAPYNVLVNQWCSEAELFGLRPINVSACSGPAGRQQAIAAARRRLRLGLTPAEVLVVSNDTLCTPEFLSQIEAYAGSKLLIADECHNLGAPAFLNATPDFFNHRLGLSATPVRQYDDEGTDGLFAFFGDVVFRFGLEEAIGKCLTPYDYFPHFISLNEGEMSEWRDLSEEIAQIAWKIDAGVKDDRMNFLLLQRRKIIETAESKLKLLADLLDAEDLRALRHTLIYATDKDPNQLLAVNQLLLDRDIPFHQLTADETANAQLVSRLIEAFQRGDLQVLTAKRVLDEGVNIPEIERAFILASTTVRRQWIQRRGRLLRLCKSIGKTHAVIHDLVALPPIDDHRVMDSDERKIINAELDRVWEFARLSRNAAVSGGPFAKVEQLKALLKDRA